MRYFYDRESDSLYLTLTEHKKYRDSLEAAPGVVLDFDSAGKLIGIDLEHASKVLDIQGIELHEEPRRAELHTAKLNGARLKQQRDELGLTQAGLGRELGVSTNTIARWERGELKIEHGSMVELAMKALRSSRTKNAKQRQRLAGRVARIPGLRNATRKSSRIGVRQTPKKNNAG